MNPFDSYLTPEQKLHVALCKYLSLACKEVFYFHVHNEGKRTLYERYMAKAMGIRAGMPDLMIPKPSHAYCGLAPELKIKPGRLTPKQREVLEQLEAYGWKVAVCYDFEEGKKVIDDYLKRSVGDGCLGACGGNKNRGLMPAPKANQYALKWDKERALELIALVEEEIEKGSYFKNLAVLRALRSFKKKHPHIKAQSHDVLRYLSHERFKDAHEVLTAIKNMETLLEGKLVEDTLKGRIKNSAMAIFYLKNHFSWRDKSERELNLKGSIPIEKWISGDDQS